MTVELLASRQLNTKFGRFTESLFRAGSEDVIALVRGDVRGAEGAVLCRIHCACLGGHVFNSIECECSEEMASAQAAIAEAGKGVIIYLDQEGKGNGHLALMLSTQFKAAGMSQADAYVAAGFRSDARDYRAAADVLRELGVSSVSLMSNDRKKADDLIKFGVKARLIEV
jgi:GTP cyclohydrolase II